jgi:hypothetical protein
LVAQIPLAGDAVKLFQSLASLTWFVVVSDDDTPPGRAITMEVVGDDAVITTDALVGKTGAPGKNLPIIDLQWSPDVETVDDLPDDLTTADADKGWWIDDKLHIWTGSKYVVRTPGPTGPPGATPQIAPTCSVIPMDERTGPGEDGEDVDSYVELTGTSAAPQWHYHLAAPQGEKGDPTRIQDAPDYDDSTAAQIGQPLTYLGDDMWGPRDLDIQRVQMYSIPEAAFIEPTSQITTHFTVLAHTIPAQNYAYIPYVTGHFRAFGIELDADPLTIATEVRLGDPVNGQMVGMGIAGDGMWNSVVPHFTEPGDSTTAVSPNGGGPWQVAKGKSAQLYFTIRNYGLIGSYSFKRDGAGATIMIIPQGL